MIEITRKVKLAEKNIYTLDKIKLSNNAEHEVKENMKINLANKIKDFSRECKINEEKYMRNYQELVGDTTNYITEDLDGSHTKTKKDFLKLESDNSSHILRQRDEEITTLLNSITELATVFKDMQTLVHYQGTILDRIDYNIDNAQVNVAEAHKELVKTEKMMKKNCYRNSMIFLMTAVFVMAILILLKFS